MADYVMATTDGADRLLYRVPAGLEVDQPQPRGCLLCGAGPRGENESPALCMCRACYDLWRALLDTRPLLMYRDQR